MELRDLDGEVFHIGKAAVIQADVAWDFDSDLHANLTQLGFTEGEVSVEFNESFNALTLPEYTGDAPHAGRRFVQGEAPVVTVPTLLADPALRAKMSPTGSASGGRRRQQPVVSRTLVLIPEELFLDLSDPEAQDVVSLVPTGSGWTLGGEPLTTEQERQLGQSVWFWSGSWTKPPMTYRHEDGGKDVTEGEFTVEYQVLAPNGHRLYTIGDPYDFGIDILTGLTES